MLSSQMATRTRYVPCPKETGKRETSAAGSSGKQPGNVGKLGNLPTVMGSGNVDVSDLTKQGQSVVSRTVLENGGRETGKPGQEDGR